MWWQSTVWSLLLSYFHQAILFNINGKWEVGSGKILDQRMIRENPFFISRSHRSWALSLHQRRRTKNKQQETNKQKVSILQASVIFSQDVLKSVKSRYNLPWFQFIESLTRLSFFFLKIFLIQQVRWKQKIYLILAFSLPPCTTTFPAEHSIINII